MKTLETLEQEAKQAREVAAMALSEVLPYGTGSGIADKIILAAVSMVTYQFALGMQEVSGDGSGEYLPEVSQEERDSDGWIDWEGGDCPVDPDLYVFVEFRNDSVTDSAYKAGSYEWRRDIVERSWDIVAYKVAK